MRILLIHNYYQQRGGEDECAEQEAALLRERGHEVRLYARRSDELKTAGALRRALVPLQATWSARASRDIARLCAEFRPDLAHVHNFFPLISPSLFYACAARRIPTVFTLHNYRLLCPGAWLFHAGSVCEDCLRRSLWQGVRRGCYHGARSHTAAVALMVAVHRRLGTWTRKVSAFVAPSEFARRKFIEGGLPADRVYLRYNFQAAPDLAAPAQRAGAVFAGRLSAEKGLDVLLDAWRRLPHVPLTIAGDGPLAPWARQYIAQHDMRHVRMLGFRPLPEVLREIQRAVVLVVPSLWYEVCIRVIIEACAAGTPVLASRLGSLSEMVEENRTGLLFRPGDAEDLARMAGQIFARPDVAAGWGAAARAVYAARYTPQVAYEGIMAIYQHVIENQSTTRRA